MDEKALQQSEQLDDMLVQTGTVTEEQTTELQTNEELLLKLDELHSSVEHVSIMLVIIFSFFVGFTIARTAVEAFFRPWK